MAFRSRPWINKSAIGQLQDLQKRYGYMAAPSVVAQAAKSAGQIFATSMQGMVRSQPDLTGYSDVAEGFTAWEGDDNIYVGFHPGQSEMVQRAQQLERQFPLMEASLDMERQTGQTRRSFDAALAIAAGLIPGLGPESSDV